MNRWKLWIKANTLQVVHSELISSQTILISFMLIRSVQRKLVSGQWIDPIHSHYSSVCISRFGRIIQKWIFFHFYPFTLSEIQLKLSSISFFWWCGTKNETFLFKFKFSLNWVFAENKTWKDSINHCIIFEFISFSERIIWNDHKTIEYTLLVGNQWFNIHL